MHTLLAQAENAAQSASFPAWAIVLIVVAVLAFWAIGVFNGLTRKRNAYKNAFAQIDVQLKRRYDLIPNLVETVKGYAKHERETLEAVIKARNVAATAAEAAAKAAGDPDAMARLASSEAALGGALSRLLVTVERYPELKANQNFMALQEELTTTENKVSFARQAYNDAVTDYNNTRAVFPAVLLAGAFGFAEAKLLEVETPEMREAPKVSF
ncbi:MAG: LemA family protein [Kiritimatiellae bacterium]|nr:LemA family protein [Kiritimatiellia bacterium]